jgi:hypothetical protein
MFTSVIERSESVGREAIQSTLVKLAGNFLRDSKSILEILSKKMANHDFHSIS